MKSRSLIFYMIFFSFCISGCKKEEDVNHAPLAEFTVIDDLINIDLVSSSSDIDNNILTCHWKINSTQVSLANKTGNSNSITVPSLVNSLNVDVTLIVSDGKLTDSVTKTIEIPKASLQRSYGLGNIVNSEISNNTSYEWYRDQMNTGNCSSVNCGPTSVTMSIKWFDENFSKTPEDARSIYWRDGGWWYTSDINNYLDMYSVYHKTISLLNSHSLTDEIDNGNIMILCLDMYYIRSQSNSFWHVDKFYPTAGNGWGHFIVVKGYKEVDNEVFFEIYDPYSMGLKYDNDELKGKNRYYRSDDIMLATDKWWKYAIVISRSQFKSADGVDVSTIEDKSGR
jgi:hypothetical protein